MDIKEQIKAEIVRQLDAYKPIVGGVDELTGAHIVLAKLLAFIDTLDEQPSENLEKAAEKYQREGRQHILDESPIGTAKDAFKAGANWQKEQMMKEAAEGEIQMRYSGCLCAKTIRAINEDKFKLGDKVKIIIVKED